nr:MAG TPA: hypothetical protein [Bacteriophage sp.]
MLTYPLKCGNIHTTARRKTTKYGGKHHERNQNF